MATTTDNKTLDRLIANYDLHCAKIRKSTTINIHERPEDRIKRINHLEGDYDIWFEYYFPNFAKVKCAWFHKLLANKIIKNKVINLLYEVYRSGAKSVHVDMGVPLYLMVKGELKYMLLIGETEPKAKQLLSSIQAQLQYNQRFIADYGTKFKSGDWADGNFMTVDGIRFKALGFGQSPRGVREESERPDYIAVDDIDSKKHVNNDTIMREGVDWIMEDLMGCFDESDTSTKRFVFANNNFHKNSITNRLKHEFTVFRNKAKEFGEKSIYTIISVPAVKNLIDFIPNWPEKTSADYWRRKYNNSTKRSFLREYMHKHVQDGKIFKDENIHHKKTLPLAKYDSLCLYGDMSYKDKGDFKGLFLVGKIGREFHIIHSFLRQTSRKNAAKWLYDLYEDKKLHKYNISYQIEGLFAMDEFVNDFDIEGDDRGYHIPVVADKRGKANKFDRIESTSGYFERNNVFFNEDEFQSPDQVELTEQYLAFEKGSNAHDDGPDAIHGAIDNLNRRTFVDKFVPRFFKHNLKNNGKY